MCKFSLIYAPVVNNHWVGLSCICVICNRKKIVPCLYLNVSYHIVLYICHQHLESSKQIWEQINLRTNMILILSCYFITCSWKLHIIWSLMSSCVFSVFFLFNILCIKTLTWTFHLSLKVLKYFKHFLERICECYTSLVLACLCLFVLTHKR
jgi:hypothetical protein